MRNNGRAYPLQQLVESYWYNKASGPTYYQGGPLVHYLIEHYGVETFFELYVGVRPSTFHLDCHTILGDSWETVESDFWKWLKSEALLIADTNPEWLDEASSEERIEFTNSIDPADWQVFVERYRAASKGVEPLPRKLAFLAEIDRTTTDEKEGIFDRQSHFEFRALFEGENFWTYENTSSNKNHFLLATEKLCAALWRDNPGTMKGWVKDHHDGPFHDVHLAAIQKMRTYCGYTDPGPLLILRGELPETTTHTITELIRPEEDSNEPWSISFTRKAEDKSEDSEYRILVDPASGWSIIHLSVQKLEGEMVADTQYQFLDGSFVPLRASSQFSQGGHRGSSKMQLRPLTEFERNELKHRVERAVSSGPRPYERLQQLLVALMIACPLLGVMLLRFAPQYVACPV
jgi:hypothetical protein